MFMIASLLLFLSHTLFNPFPYKYTYMMQHCNVATDVKTIKSKEHFFTIYSRKQALSKLLDYFEDIITQITLRNIKDNTPE